MEIVRHQLSSSNDVLELDNLSDFDREVVALYDLLGRDDRSENELDIDVVADILADFDEQDCITIIENGRLAAVANVRWEQKKDQAWLERMVVAPMYRGQGVGERLVEYIDQERRSRQLGRLALRSVASAVGFYEKLGFDEEFTIATLRSNQPLMVRR